jgi:hypothetical protein
MKSIEDWLPVLGWNNIPHYGSIHDLTSEEIIKFYIILPISCTKRVHC